MVVIPPTVKPYRANLAVTCQQFGELGVHEVEIMWPVALGAVLAAMPARAAHGIILAHPVDMAVIEV